MRFGTGFALRLDTARRVPGGEKTGNNNDNQICYLIVVSGIRKNPNNGGENKQPMFTASDCGFTVGGVVIWVAPIVSAQSKIPNKVQNW